MKNLPIRIQKYLLETLTEEQRKVVFKPEIRGSRIRRCQFHGFVINLKLLDSGNLELGVTKTAKMAMTYAKAMCDIKPEHHYNEFIFCQDTLEFEQTLGQD